MEKRPLPSGWEWKTLADISEVNPRRPIIKRNDEIPTSFVPMAAVDEVEGRFAQVETKPCGEIKRGYTYFEENDVVFAKITPCMENGKAAVARGLLDGFGFGTTEFHVLRPKPGVLPAWIHHFVRQADFRREAKEHFRGAVGQQRVPQDFLEGYRIPIPYPDDPARSLETQRRIVARIEALFAELRECRKLHQAVVEDTNRLMEAVLAEVFLDPIHRVPDGWLVKTVGEISSPPQYGYTQSARKEPVGPQFLRITDIQGGKVDWSSVPYCECNDAAHARYQLADGDIVFARSGATTGKTLLVKNPPDAVFASYLIRLRIVKDATPDFVWWFFQSPYYWKQIILRGGAQPNMNAQILKSIRVPIPTDRSLQSQIVARLDAARSEIREMQAVSDADTKLLSDMEEAILAQAFQGEL